MGLKSIIWDESRSILVNVLILLTIFIVFMLALSFIAGLFGVAWLRFTDWLGLGNITVEQAIGYFGSPSALINWLNVWLYWAAGIAYQFFTWLGNGILWALGVNAGNDAAAATGQAATGAAIAGGGAAYYKAKAE